MRRTITTVASNCARYKIYVKVQYYFSSDHKPDNKKIHVRVCEYNVREKKRARDLERLKTTKSIPIMEKCEKQI